MQGQRSQRHIKILTPSNVMPAVVALGSTDPRRDWEATLEAVANGGAGALIHVSAELRDDWELMLAAIARDQSALAYASAQLKSDRRFVLAAVARNGRALQYASRGLRTEDGR